MFGRERPPPGWRPLPFGRRLGLLESILMMLGLPVPRIVMREPWVAEEDEEDARYEREKQERERRGRL
jgi:hypothetical protein